MSADDQTFLDTLSAVPNDVKRFSSDVAEYIDRQIEQAATVLRETLSSSPWIPETARPKAPPNLPTPRIVVPLGLFPRVQDWIEKHKLLTGSAIIGIGATVYFAYRKQKSYTRKRRAKRASNGARLEVVVLAGSPSESITRSIALDLERRGFIVFIVCNDVEEEVMVQNEARTDIRPLTIDVSHSVSSGNTIERLTSYLQTPQHAFEGARPHHLLFTALIIIPSLNYPTAPVATIAPSHISDLLNTRLLHPILITQSFLPLLTSLPFSHPHHHSPPHSPPSPPKILLLTPSIISSLSPPFHAPESLVVSALTAFAKSLSAEIRPLGIAVTQIQMGSFDISSLNPRNQLQVQNIQAQRAEMLGWPEGTRHAYGRNFLRVTERGTSSAPRGSPLRELHNAVFDAMARKKGGIVKAGMGSAMYELVGAWVPRSLIGWMMGVQRVKTLSQSPLGSETGSDSHKEEAGLAGDSAYIPVG